MGRETEESGSRRGRGWKRAEKRGKRRRRKHRRMQRCLGQIARVKTEYMKGKMRKRERGKGMEKGPEENVEKEKERMDKEGEGEGMKEGDGDSTAKMSQLACGPTRLARQVTELRPRCIESLSLLPIPSLFLSLYLFRSFYLSLSLSSISFFFFISQYYFYFHSISSYLHLFLPPHLPSPFIQCKQDTNCQNGKSVSNFNKKSQSLSHGMYYTKPIKDSFILETSYWQLEEETSLHNRGNEGKKGRREN